MKGHQQDSQREDGLTIFYENEKPSEPNTLDSIGEPKCAETSEVAVACELRCHNKSFNETEPKPKVEEEVEGKDVSEDMFGMIFIPSDESCEFSYNYKLPYYSQHERVPRIPKNTETHVFEAKNWEHIDDLEATSAHSEAFNFLETDYFQLLSGERNQETPDPKRLEAPDDDQYTFSYFQNDSCKIQKEESEEKSTCSPSRLISDKLFNMSFVDVLQHPKLETPSSPKKQQAKITYENRNILNLVSNLRGSFCTPSGGNTSNGSLKWYENGSQDTRLFGMRPPPHRDIQCQCCGFTMQEYERTDESDSK